VVSHLHYVCHRPRPSHPLWFDHCSNNLWTVQIMQLLIMQFSSFCPLGLKYSNQHPVPNTPNPGLWFSYNVREQQNLLRVGFEILTAVSTKMAVFCVVALCSHQLMMEAARTSGTSVNFYQTTRRYNSEDSHLKLVTFQFYILMLTFLDLRREGEWFWTEDVF
jgi:hypothetical protein